MKFAELVHTIEKAGGRFSHDCADVVRFLAFGGFRLGEAKNMAMKVYGHLRNQHSPSTAKLVNFAPSKPGSSQ
ncbi:MAG TPA: hypothetical protein VFC44_01925 [Candidatus Saccharimonadales bacterium]|nr:hypothetical protein [Candidatus Saccharimonadales bacterium]